MSDTYSGHYAYPLVTWRATFLGAVVAFVVAVMLNLLGAALGIAALAAGQTTSATGASILSVIWVGVANLLALGFGAWLAARSTEAPDYHGGALQGIAVWALTSLATLVLATSSLSTVAGGALDTASQAVAGAVSTTASNSTPAQAQAQGQAAAQTATNAYQQNAGAVQNAAQQAAGVTAAAAFGVFLAMLLGLIAAIIGGRLGARHPKWENRPRYSYVEHRAPPRS